MAKSRKRKRGRRSDDCRNVVVVSDLHCGSALGLCPADGILLDDGGTYSPSVVQKKMWTWWLEFWNEWVPKVTHGEDYDVVINGDLVDGKPHKSVAQITDNMDDQREIAFQVLEPIAQRARKFYVVRGTEAHVGKSGQEEENLAKRLNAVPGEYGARARWELWKRVGTALVHFSHHIGTTSSAAHESSAVNAELSIAYVEAGRWDEEPPDIIVRSHRHRCIEVRLPAVKNGELRYATAVTTPAWQLKTPYTFKVAGARQSQPQVGGILIRAGDEEIHTRHWVKNIDRPRVE